MKRGRSVSILQVAQRLPPQEIVPHCIKAKSHHCNRRCYQSRNWTGSQYDAIWPRNEERQWLLIYSPNHYHETQSGNISGLSRAQMTCWSDTEYDSTGFCSCVLLMNSIGKWCAQFWSDIVFLWCTILLSITVDRDMIWVVSASVTASILTLGWFQSLLTSSN